MLKNQNYSKSALAKTAYFAPLIAFLLLLNCKLYGQEDIKRTLPPSNDTIYSWAEEVKCPEGEVIYKFVDVMPDFPEGTKALYKYISEHICYPQEAREKNIMGTVVVQFVITKEGDVCNVKVLTSAHPILDAEAVRVIKSLPKWTPGKNKGKPVHCWYNLPVTFSLQ